MNVKIFRVLYEDISTGFSICASKVVAGRDSLPATIDPDNLVLVGYYPKNKVCTLEVDGQIEKAKNPKYGYQFRVTAFKEQPPVTTDGLVAYLAGFVNGLQERTAQKIVATFGLNTINVFENEPERLLSVRGIGRKKLVKIINSFNANRSMQGLVQFLAPYGVTPNKCIKISKAFGGEALEIIKNEPFRLCEIDGFGFKTVDEIARATNFSMTDPLRVRGAIKFVLQSEQSEGHLCLPQLELLGKSYLLLNLSNASKACETRAIEGFKKTANPGILASVVTEEVPFSLVLDIFRDMALDYSLKGDNGMAYLPSNYEQEVETAAIIARRLKLPSMHYDEKEIRSVIAEEEKKLGIKLAAKQVEAVILGVNCRTSIITGGPGVGKTTVLKMVLTVCQKFERVSPADIALFAPTGRAAQRMAESVGDDYTASTIHSGLGIGADGFRKVDTIEAKIVVIDEASMVDAFVGYNLLQALPDSAKLIIIGDPDQLPSVGPGNVLYELLHCGEVPTVKLDVIYRQSGTSPIVINSDLIKHNVSNLRYDDKFVFIDAEGEDTAAKVIVEQFLAAVKRDGLDNVQVLCPMRKKGHAAGAIELNKVIQDKLNPYSPKKNQIGKGDRIFRVGDKVILTKNNYDIPWEKDNGEAGEGMFNGDTGYITDIDIDNDDVYINFYGKRVIFDVTQMQDLELAYAISVHKSQGAEWRTVLIPLCVSFYIMLKRNLIYTGITRAKENVILVGQKNALAQAIHTNEIAKRNTQLGDRIKKAMTEVK